MTDATAPGQHVVVLVHGLLGSAADLAFIGRALRARYSAAVVVLAPSVNHGRTLGGIGAQTRRLYGALLGAMQPDGEAPGARYLSLVGHSLGGLVARRLAYILHRDGVVPARLRPLALVTIATPHVGSRHHARLVPRAGALLAALALGQTGRELFLDDDAMMLWTMTDAAHLDALRLFRVRVLYACAHSDLSVAFETAALARRNLHRDAPAGSLLELDDDDDEDDDGCLLDPLELQLCDRLRRVPWRRFAFVPPRILFGHLDVVVAGPARAPYGAVVVRDLVEHMRIPD